MKSTGDNTAGTGLWNSPNTGADDSSGFSGLPGGARGNGGSVFDIGNSAFFWTTTEFGSSDAWRYDLDSGNNQFNKSSGFSKFCGASVRCLKN
jgi:uncharacterized protein (TIGR02145 family)